MSSQDPPSIHTTPIAGSEPIEDLPHPESIPVMEEPEPPTPEEELAALRRAFPTPRRREADPGEEETGGLDWQWLGTRILVGTAVVMAGAAGWKLLQSPTEKPAKPAATAQKTTPTAAPPQAADEALPAAVTPPPDDAAALYLSSDTPPAAPAGETQPPAGESPPVPDAPADPAVMAEANPATPLPPESTSPAATESPASPGLADPAMAENTGDPAAENPFDISPATPEAEAPPPAPQELGPLEEKYLAALLRASAGVTAGDVSAWTAEIERVKKGLPLPESTDTMPEGLQRLLSIYRKEKEKAAAAAITPSADTREIELFIMGDDRVQLLLNGEPAPTMYVSGSAETPGSVQKATLTLKPGDVLGFNCKNNGGWGYFAATARAGVRWLFSSSDRWDAAVDPPADWWKGEGRGSARVNILRGRTDYSVSTAAAFEKAADSHSSEYRVLWAGKEDRCSFRYRIRSVDLPEKPAPR